MSRRQRRRRSKCVPIQRQIQARIIGAAAGLFGGGSFFVWACAAELLREDGNSQERLATSRTTRTNCVSGFFPVE